MCQKINKKRIFRFIQNDCKTNTKITFPLPRIYKHRITKKIKNEDKLLYLYPLGVRLMIISGEAIKNILT